jgi:hypothetical protein
MWVILSTFEGIWRQGARGDDWRHSSLTFPTLSLLLNFIQFYESYFNLFITGRAIAQAVSRWLPTAAAARVQTRV